MGVYKRRRIWWFDYMAHGRQVRESSGSTNKRIAEALLAKRKTEVLEERWSLPKSNCPRLADWLQQIVNDVPHKNTRERYDASRKNLIAFLGSVKLTELTPERVDEFRQFRLVSKKKHPATVNRDVGLLSKALRIAVKHRLITINPCAQLEHLNERRMRRQAKPLSYEEEVRLSSVCSPHLRMLVTLLIETGLRAKKEALTLTWKDVQLENDPAYIEIRDSKTAAGRRRVWLTDHCRNELIRWKQFLGPEHSPFVFPAIRNPKEHWSEYRSAWERAVKAAKLTDRRAYDLRATFASRANAAHATPITLAQLLGHSSTTILPTYAKPLDENTRAIIRTLDELRATSRTDTTLRNEAHGIPLRGRLVASRIMRTESRD